MASSTTYSLLGYGRMITDRSRMGPYRLALRQAVRPGCLVVDIGAGTGIFSMLACQMGAGHVHAIEPDDTILIAQAMAADNRYSERISFHQALSSRVTLPKLADVIVSDLRGVLPLMEHHIPAIIDARQRLLAPGGALIPLRDHLWAALVEDPERYRPYTEPWLSNDFDLDMHAGRHLAINDWCKVHIQPDRLLVEPQRWATLDYGTVEDLDVTGQLSWVAQRPGTAHGLLLWFDAELSEGIGFSNAPGQPELIYGQAFFPLQAPMAIDAGDRIEVLVKANLVGNDYVWSWNTQVSSARGAMKADYRQSTFFAAPLSPSKLKRRQASHIPAASQALEVDRFCLSLADGATPLSEIAEKLARRFPNQFKDRKHAMNHAADLLEPYDQAASGQQAKIP